MGAALASTLILAGSLMSGTAAPTGSPSPLALFRSVCMEGGSTLKKDQVENATLQHLPAEARTALEISTLPYRVPASRASNSIYGIRGPQRMFLLVPRTSGTSEADVYAGSCAVIWKADQYAEAKKMIMPYPDPEWLRGTSPKDNPLGLAHSATDNGDLNLTVAAFGGWTVLRSARSTRNSTETTQSVDPGR